MPREDLGRITAVARSFGSSAYRAAQVPYRCVAACPGPYPFVLSDAKTRQTVCNAQSDELRREVGYVPSSSEFLAGCDDAPQQLVKYGWAR
jgi:hypothetical protein